MYAVEFSPSKSCPICESEVNAGLNQIILHMSVFVLLKVNMFLICITVPAL